jgi:Domain of unknown function (DUF4375)
MKTTIPGAQLPRLSPAWAGVVSRRLFQLVHGLRPAQSGPVARRGPLLGAGIPEIGRCVQGRTPSYTGRCRIESPSGKSRRPPRPLSGVFGPHAKRLRMPDYRVRRSPDTASLPDIIELLADAWAEATNATTRRQILDSATRGQRLLLAYHWYSDDVTNGGHWQYFWNYTGDLWQHAVEATQVLRLPDERILRDALALFPDKQPGATRRERRQRLARISRAKLDKLDERFYDLPGDEKRIRRFIEKHPEEFFLPQRSKRSSGRTTGSS